MNTFPYLVQIMTNPVNQKSLVYFVMSFDYRRSLHSYVLQFSVVFSLLCFFVSQASVHHANGVLVISPCRTPLSSVLNVKATLPSTGERRSSQSSSEKSDGEEGTESTGDSRPGYNLRASSDLLSSSSSSSSSSLSACLSPVSDTTSDLLSSLQPEVSVSTERQASVGLKLATHSVTARTVQTSKEEGDGMDSQDVNLLTLTFGSHEKEEEGLEQEHVGVTEPRPPSASEEINIKQQTWDDTDFAMETTSADEEEESGYMGRPCTDTLKKLLQ